jgi:hypothetical protein
VRAEVKADIRPSAYARALLREREGYVLSGKVDRVAQVDNELDRLGVKPPREAGAPETTKQQPPAEKATPPRPR